MMTNNLNIPQIARDDKFQQIYENETWQLLEEAKYTYHRMKLDPIYFFKFRSDQPQLCMDLCSLMENDGKKYNLSYFIQKNPKILKRLRKKYGKGTFDIPLYSDHEINENISPYSDNMLILSLQTNDLDTFQELTKDLHVSSYTASPSDLPQIFVNLFGKEKYFSYLSIALFYESNDIVAFIESKNYEVEQQELEMAARRNNCEFLKRHLNPDHIIYNIDNIAIAAIEYDAHEAFKTIGDIKGFPISPVIANVSIYSYHILALPESLLSKGIKIVNANEHQLKSYRKLQNEIKGKYPKFELYMEQYQIIIQNVLTSIVDVRLYVEKRECRNKAHTFIEIMKEYPDLIESRTLSAAATWGLSKLDSLIPYMRDPEQLIIYHIGDAFINWEIGSRRSIKNLTKAKVKLDMPNWRIAFDNPENLSIEDLEFLIENNVPMCFCRFREQKHNIWTNSHYFSPEVSNLILQQCMNFAHNEDFRIVCEFYYYLMNLEKAEEILRKAAPLDKQENHRELAFVLPKYNLATKDEEFGADYNRMNILIDFKQEYFDRNVNDVEIFKYLVSNKKFYHNLKILFNNEEDRILHKTAMKKYFDCYIEMKKFGFYLEKELPQEIKNELIAYKTRNSVYSQKKYTEQELMDAIETKNESMLKKILRSDIKYIIPNNCIWVGSSNIFKMVLGKGFKICPYSIAEIKPTSAQELSNLINYGVVINHGDFARKLAYESNSNEELFYKMLKNLMGENEECNHKCDKINPTAILVKEIENACYGIGNSNQKISILINLNIQEEGVLQAMYQNEKATLSMLDLAIKLTPNSQRKIDLRECLEKRGQKIFNYLKENGVSDINGESPNDILRKHENSQIKSIIENGQLSELKDFITRLSVNGILPNILSEIIAFACRSKRYLQLNLLLDYADQDMVIEGLSIAEFIQLLNDPDVNNLFKSHDLIEISPMEQLMEKIHVKDDAGATAVIKKYSLDVNYIFENSTPLLEAVKEDSYECVSVLINCGADPTYYDPNGGKAVEAAINKNSMKIFELLFRNGAEFPTGIDFLEKALAQGEEGFIDLVVSNGYKFKHFSYRCGSSYAEKYQNQTLLDYSKFVDFCRCREVKEIEKLIELRVEIDVKNSEGLSPLISACIGNNTDVVNLLLQKGASPNQTCADGSPLLVYLIKNGHDKLIPFLVKNGAKIDFSFNNESILQIATYYGNIDVVKFLVEKEGMKFGDQKYRFGNLDIAKYLIHNNAFFDTQSFEYSKPEVKEYIQKLMSSSNPETVEHLHNLGLPHNRIEKPIPQPVPKEVQIEVRKEVQIEAPIEDPPKKHFKSFFESEAPQEIKEYDTIKENIENGKYESSVPFRKYQEKKRRDNRNTYKPYIPNPPRPETKPMSSEFSNKTEQKNDSVQHQKNDSVQSQKNDPGQHQKNDSVQHQKNDSVQHQKNDSMLHQKNDPKQYQKIEKHSSPTHQNQSNSFVKNDSIETINTTQQNISTEKSREKRHSRKNDSFEINHEIKNQETPKKKVKRVKKHSTKEPPQQSDPQFSQQQYHMYNQQMPYPGQQPVYGIPPYSPQGFPSYSPQGFPPYSPQGFPPYPPHGFPPYSPQAYDSYVPPYHQQYEFQDIPQSSPPKKEERGHKRIKKVENLPKEEKNTDNEFRRAISKGKSGKEIDKILNKGVPFGFGKLVCSDKEVRDVVFKHASKRLFDAASTDNSEDAREILSLELVPIDYTNQNGDTALHVACKKGSKSVVRLLLGKGANPHIKNIRNAVPAVEAAKSGSLEVMRTLNACDVDINFKDDNGITTIQYVASSENVKLFKWMIEMKFTLGIEKIDGAVKEIMDIIPKPKKKKVVHHK